MRNSDKEEVEMKDGVERPGMLSGREDRGETQYNMVSPLFPIRVDKENFLPLVSLIAVLALVLFVAQDDGVEPQTKTIVYVIGLIITGGFAAFAFHTLLKAVTGSAPPIIRLEDRELLVPLIREGNEKAIDQYIRLSSLVGATGSATKLGLTGLPLATIGLTVFFAILAVFQPSSFLDLAKLTLGAFVGSFVQRAISSEGSRRSVDAAEGKENRTSSQDRGDGRTSTTADAGSITSVGTRADAA